VVLEQVLIRPDKLVLVPLVKEITVVTEQTLLAQEVAVAVLDLLEQPQMVDMVDLVEQAQSTVLPTVAVELVVVETKTETLKAPLESVAVLAEDGDITVGLLSQQTQQAMALVAEAKVTHKMLDTVVVTGTRD
jgi:hypothetical protein